MAIVAPSFLSANFLQLQEECDKINTSEAEWYHLDVMDGSFVPNISFGIPVIAALRKATKKVLDVHLMIVEPEKYIAAFADAGANVLTVHLEASVHLHRTIQQIKQHGMKAGVALNPHTPVSLLQDVITDLDLVCLMSVNPGFGGQKFIERTYQKVRDLKAMIVNSGSNCLIEIDGGVTLDNAKKLTDAGADVLVAGNTVFASPDPLETIRLLRLA
ncbi:MAG: ribulose-phosphate 3-epimerase [Hydrotalea sp.]|nr:ribulose-phosphate 3-epimerase [Hydrotalea sp.]